MSQVDEDFKPAVGEEVADTGRSYWLRLTKENIVPGITVALISVPLCTALAIAAGADPMMGLMTAVYGPGVGGLLGGSNYNIFGPAAALANILNVFTIKYGIEIVPIVAILGGLIQSMVYFLKLEKYCLLIPVSVLEGFSISVAVSVGFGQLNAALGI